MTDKPMPQRNLAHWDRALRTVVGLILLAAWGLHGFAGWWMPILGVALLVNAAIGSCALYKAIGFSTCPVKLPPVKLSEKTAPADKPATPPQ